MNKKEREQQIKLLEKEYDEVIAELSKDLKKPLSLVLEEKLVFNNEEAKQIRSEMRRLTKKLNKNDRL